mmetsp:Transcript_18883/g.60595  ORF Transcript_18883/g.60595 Transcript_18883/m.60595 type:complete len:363 (+) Transcript_18883:123-1211(+)
MVAIHGSLDAHGGIFLALALFYFLSIAAPAGGGGGGASGAYGHLRLEEQPHAVAKMATFVALVAVPPAALPSATLPCCGLGVALLCLWAPRFPLRFALAHATDLTGAAAAAAAAYGFLGPVLGLQMMASSTMYGNVKNYGGSNHLLVPTGLLQTALAEQSSAAAAPAWLSDAFGGGLVRIDATNSSVLLSLAVGGAEMTDKLPLRARELLSSANASGRYFEFYAARNYYERSYDHDKTALHAAAAAAGATDSSDPAYVVPAYELRRSLALARRRGEPFSLEYTPLPPGLGTPTQWRAHAGEKVSLDEAADGLVSCVVGRAREACGAAELALLPPPPWLLTRVLLPYPIPLLDGAGDGIHCTT